ncbi:glycosyltransferase [Mucilaginibacter terrenus]|uniref:Glycosyltransferase n=1 Tax=Mucilaginibacter terrenus TaxID=2482727 RepID=A0A3E2NMM2_9SPHI|nr:glycosyltransferase family 4 protein [Mucilaginibacter terrenus]RFZ82245.1 glycosyltransferase [Mucilaginibacter terrenus]
MSINYPKKLAIITTHPIQYYAPVFRLLAQQLDLKVFYTWGEASLSKHDPGFGKKIKWDIDLLDGYKYEWVHNSACDKGSHHYKGIKNPSLITELEQWQPDAILVYGWAYHSHLRVIRHFSKKIKLLFRGDSTLLDDSNGVKSHLKAVFLRWVYNHIDIAIYPGQNTMAYFKKYGVEDHRLVFAPHAVENSRFAEDRSVDAAAIRASLYIDNERLMILFAGKFEKKKDPLLLLKAFQQLSQPNIHLLFVGNGPLEKELKQHANCWANIHFLNFQNQSAMPAVYQACDLFCLPSMGPAETWGLAVNEAMACSKAIIASDKTGCVPDLVVNGRNGFIFKAGDVTSLLEKLNLAVEQGKMGLTSMGKVSNEMIIPWNFEVQAEVIVKQVNG